MRRFTRAIQRRQLRNAEMAARELSQLTPTNALALLLLIRDQAPERYERAAARWVAPFLEAAGPMTLADLELIVAGLRALTRESRSAAGVLASVADEYARWRAPAGRATLATAVFCRSFSLLRACGHLSRGRRARG
jgi:hypothetical protein